MIQVYPGAHRYINVAETLRWAIINKPRIMTQLLRIARPILQRIKMGTHYTCGLEQLRFRSPSSTHPENPQHIGVVVALATRNFGRCLLLRPPRVPPLLDQERTSCPGRGPAFLVRMARPWELQVHLPCAWHAPQPAVQQHPPRMRPSQNILQHSLHAPPRRRPGESGSTSPQTDLAEHSLGLSSRRSSPFARRPFPLGP